MSGTENSSTPEADALTRADNMSKVDGVVSRYLNRHMSVPLARAMQELRWITPDRVSWMALAIACLAAVIYAVGDRIISGGYTIYGVTPGLILGGTFVQVSSIVDGADGDLARLRGTASARGGVLDAILDRYADLAILTGLFFAVSNQGGSVALLPFSLVVVTVPTEGLFVVYVLAVAGSLMVSYSRARLENMGLFQRRDNRFLGMTRDVRLFVIFLCSLMGCPLLALLLVATVGNLTVAARLRSIS